MPIAMLTPDGRETLREERGWVFMRVLVAFDHSMDSYLFCLVFIPYFILCFVCLVIVLEDYNVFLSYYSRFLLLHATVNIFCIIQRREKHSQINTKAPNRKAQRITFILLFN